MFPIFVIVMISLISFNSSLIASVFVQNDLAPRAVERTGVRSGGVGTDQMNTAPTDAPSSDEELLDNTTLTDEVYESSPYQDEPFLGTPVEIEAQEEGPLDYSATPEMRPLEEPEIIDE